MCEDANLLHISLSPMKLARFYSRWMFHQIEIERPMKEYMLSFINKYSPPLPPPCFQF